MADPPKSPTSTPGDANGVSSPGSPKTPTETSPRVVKKPLRDRLERQTSRDSTKGPRLRTISSGASLSGRVRTESGSSGRRPSLSLGHADAIPWNLEKPEEIDLDEGKIMEVHT